MGVWGGWIMTVPSASKQPRIHPCGGIPLSQGCRPLPSWDTSREPTVHSVPSVGRWTIRGRNVPSLIWSPRAPVRLQAPVRWHPPWRSGVELGQKISASPGTRGIAPFQVPAPATMPIIVPHASSQPPTTWPGTVPGHPSPPISRLVQAQLLLVVRPLAGNSFHGAPAWKMKEHELYLSLLLIFTIIHSVSILDPHSCSYDIRLICYPCGCLGIGGRGSIIIRVGYSLWVACLAHSVRCRYPLV